MPNMNTFGQIVKEKFALEAVEADLVCDLDL